MKVRLYGPVLLFCITLFISVVQLSAEETRPGYPRGELPKRVTLVKTPVPPTIDGIMDKDEWKYAAQITGLTHVFKIYQWGVQACVCVLTQPERGMIHNVASHQSTFWVAYDDEHLYVAHHSPPPPQIEGDIIMIPVMLRQNQTVRDSNIDNDDSINIEIVSPSYPHGDNYVFQINSIGTIFECIFGGSEGSMPGITLGWNPEVKRESTLTLDGWKIEVAIPWRELEPYIQKPGKGETLHMNFGRMWREMIDEDHAWAGYDAYRPKGEVVFAGEEGVVVRLKDTGVLPRGQAAFNAEIANFSQARKELKVEVITDSGELGASETIVLGPYEQTEYSFKGLIGDFATTKITFMVTDAETGQPVHITSLPVIRPTSPEIYLYKYRSRDMLKLWTDITYMGTADINRAVINVDIRSRDTGRRVFRRRYSRFTSYNPVVEIPTKGWELGDYDIEITFSVRGVETRKRVIDYEYPPLPVWWNNRYGLEDIDNDVVPYPWTDMEVDDDTIRVWGRSYDFGSSILPGQVTALDNKILRAPVHIRLETSAGEVIDTSTLGAETEWTAQNKTRVEGRRLVEGGTVAIENNLWSEYDGLVWNTLTLSSPANATVASMQLRIPVTKEFTDVINNSDYHMRYTGKLRPEGNVLHLRTTWLGNGDGGLQWVKCDCGEDGFRLKDTTAAIRAEMSEEGATLVVDMIDIPVKLDVPHQMQFGLIATPVRPKINRTPFFRNSSIIGGGPWYPSEGHPGDLSFMPAPDPGYDFYGGGRRSGRIYVSPGIINTGVDASGTADFKHYGDEWTAEKFARPYPRNEFADIIKTTLASQSGRDYFVWRHWRYQQVYGFRGLYYDGDASPTLAARDIWRRLYNIALTNQHYAAREANIGIHYSAMFNMAVFGFGTYNWDAENYNSIINANQQTYIGVVDPAMYRAQHMGHNFGWPLFFLGQGRIRREWVEANGGPEAVFDQISGLDLLHDGSGVCCIMPRIEGKYPQDMRRVSERMSNVVKSLHLKHWVYQFMPYWQQKLIETPDNVYASIYLARPSLLSATENTSWPHRRGVFGEYFEIYRHLPPYIRAELEQDFERERLSLELFEDRAVLIVYNDSEWEGEMRLEVDWQKLGLGSPDTLNAENAVHSSGFRLEKGVDEEGAEFEKAVFFNRPEEYAKIEDGKIVFPMTRHNYRMIVLEKNR